MKLRRITLLFLLGFGILSISNFLLPRYDAPTKIKNEEIVPIDYSKTAEGNFESPVSVSESTKQFLPDQEEAKPPSEQQTDKPIEHLTENSEEKPPQLPDKQPEEQLDIHSIENSDEKQTENHESHPNTDLTEDNKEEHKQLTESQLADNIDTKQEQGKTEDIQGVVTEPSDQQSSEQDTETTDENREEKTEGNPPMYENQQQNEHETLMSTENSENQSPQDVTESSVDRVNEQKTEEINHEEETHSLTQSEDLTDVTRVEPVNQSLESDTEERNEIIAGNSEEQIAEQEINPLGQQPLNDESEQLPTQLAAHVPENSEDHQNNIDQLDTQQESINYEQPDHQFEKLPEGSEERLTEKTVNDLDIQGANHPTEIDFQYSGKIPTEDVDEKSSTQESEETEVHFPEERVESTRQLSLENSENISMGLSTVDNTISDVNRNDISPLAQNIHEENNAEKESDIHLPQNHNLGSTDTTSVYQYEQDIRTRMNPVDQVGNEFEEQVDNSDQKATESISEDELPSQQVADIYRRFTAKDLKRSFGIEFLQESVIHPQLQDKMSYYNISDDSLYRELANSGELKELHDSFIPFFNSESQRISSMINENGEDMSNFYIKRKGDSNTDYGVYLEKTIGPRTIIGEYTGELVLSENLIDKRYTWTAPNMTLWNTKERNWISSKVSIDGSRMGNVLRFVHDLGYGTWNVAVKWVPIQNKWRLFYVSTRAITSGEELSIQLEDSERNQNGANVEDNSNIVVDTITRQDDVQQFVKSEEISRRQETEYNIDSEIGHENIINEQVETVDRSSVEDGVIQKAELVGHMDSEENGANADDMVVSEDVENSRDDRSKFEDRENGMTHNNIQVEANLQTMDRMNEDGRDDREIRLGKNVYE